MQSPRDEWLLPVLLDMLPSGAIERIAAARGLSHWDRALASGMLTEQELLFAISRRAGAQVASDLSVSAAARAAVPAELARRYLVLPLSVAGDTLEVATSNPYDLDCERTLAFWSGRKVRLSVAAPGRISDRLEEVYGEKNAADTIVGLVDRIVARGVAEHASDIHLEPAEYGVTVRYRIDGLLREVMLLSKSVGLPLVSRLKIMARMDIADRLRPQGGHAAVVIDGRTIDLRVSSLPASHGEKVVIRILDTGVASRSLSTLGLDGIDGPRFRRLLDVHEGLILVTGPTGSGKTTTLYAALREIQRRGLNIITVEDPVEYRIPGIVQVQINEKAGLTFASALRSILRQDPDVVLIGEIRDRETAAIAIQAALTGHLVFATLHTNDACSSITRITDLGVECAKLAPALKGIVAQRLIRRLCPACRVVANDGAPLVLRPSVPEGAMVYAPTGCELCGMAGYRGRQALTEIIVTDTELERSIASGCSMESLAAVARRSGARSLWDAGVARLLAGETGGDELLRVLEQQTAGPAAGADVAEDSQKLSGQARVPVERYDSPDAASAVPVPGATLTAVTPGVVDVYVIRPLASGWRVLVLQRSADMRCPGAWESVHGNIDQGEKPEDAARRELREETGLEIARLYNVTVNPFYLHTLQAVQLAIVFAAFVDEPADVTLGPEHQRFEWLSPEAALERFVWPRERQALGEIRQLLSRGDAGPVEDVLRVF